MATAVASDVTSTIMAQRLELNNKNKTVEMLQKALSQQRELTVYHAKEMEKEGQRRLDLQKQEYEGTIQRHQCFIDQVKFNNELTRNSIKLKCTQGIHPLGLCGKFFNLQIIFCHFCTHQEKIKFL